MPTLEELKAQMQTEGVTDQAERNRRIATMQKAGAPQAAPQEGPELTDEQVAQIMGEPAQPELTGEEAAQRLTPLPEEQPTFEGIVRQMAQNYQTSPQYQQLLDQEISRISEQIAELTQRRNIIEMARRGQG